MSEKKRIVSCTSWNYYPAEVWGRVSRSKKPYGPLLAQMVKFYSLSSPKDREIFVKYSQGVFSVLMFDIGTHREKLKLANRLARSKDKKIKGRALSILPVDKIRWALYDSDYSASKAVNGVNKLLQRAFAEPSALVGLIGLAGGSVGRLLAEYEDVVEHINNITEDTQTI